MSRRDIQADFEHGQRTLDEMTPRPTGWQILGWWLCLLSAVVFLLSLSSCGMLIGYLVFGR